MYNGNFSTAQKETENYNAPNFINQRIPTQNVQGRYPQTIDHLSQSNTINVDTYKRNELYAMLREEVMSVIRQSQVSRETIMNMKKDVRSHKKTIRAMNNDYEQLMEDKEGCIEQNRLMEQDLKEQEFQNEEL